MHKIFPNFFVFLDQYDSQIFKNNNTNLGIIYRNYSAVKREKELIKIAKACKKSRNQLFISNDIKLTIKFKAEGIYIPSFNKTKGFSNLEKKNIKIFELRILPVLAQISFRPLLSFLILKISAKIELKISNILPYNFLLHNILIYLQVYLNLFF